MSDETSRKICLQCREDFHFLDLLGEAQYDEEEVVQTFKEMLTEEEWNRIKISESGAFFIFITYDKFGEPKEIHFRLFKKDPLLSLNKK